MFERFTDATRRVLVLAQEQAQLLGHNFIGTEHILLGLIHEEEGVAAEALAALGVRPDDVRREVTRLVGTPAGATIGSPQFTPRAKKVLELSLREALQLGHNYIGTEHLLLGLIRQGEGVAVQVLTTLGAGPDRVRQQVVAMIGGQPPPHPAEAGSGSVQTERDGPRCPGCRAPLAGHVGYRALAVAPPDQSVTAGTIDVMFVYCLRCGAMLTHIPTKDLAVSSAGGSHVVADVPGASAAGAHQPERIIAEGDAGDNAKSGWRWTLRAGGDDDDYSTMLTVQDDAGVISAGGMAGPKLWGSSRLNVYSGGNPDRGPRGIVVRAHLSVEHLTVVHEDGAETEMIMCGQVDGLRFAVLLVSPGARLREVVGAGADGEVIERFDLRGHDGPWHGDRR